MAGANWDYYTIDTNDNDQIMFPSKPGGDNYFVQGGIVVSPYKNSIHITGSPAKHQLSTIPYQYLIAEINTAEQVSICGVHFIVRQITRPTDACLFVAYNSEGYGGCGVGAYAYYYSRWIGVHKEHLKQLAVFLDVRLYQGLIPKEFESLRDKVRNHIK